MSMTTKYSIPEFQSTLPARGATLQRLGVLLDQRIISIHAPRTGSDR